MALRKLLLILLLFSVAQAQTPMSKLLRKKATSGCTDADALKYFAATGITDAGQKTAICDFIAREKAASRWGTEVQAFYILANGSFNASKYNLIDTTKYTCSTSGTITYSTGSGGGADPTSGAYLTTNYKPSVDQVSVNSFHLMFFSQQDVNETSTDIGILNATYNSDIELYSNTMYSTLCRTNYATYLSSALSNTLGMFLSNRTTSTAVEIFQNSTSLSSGSISAQGLPTDFVYIFSSNLANFSTKKACFVSIGAGISNVSDYYTSVNQLKTDLGL